MQTSPHQIQNRDEDMHAFVRSITRTIFSTKGVTEFLPDHCWDLTFIRNRQGTLVLRTGLTTRPVQFDFEPGDELFSIAFRPWTFMPLMPGERMRDEGVLLDLLGRDRFELGSEVFEIPRLDNVEDFVRRLVKTEAVQGNGLVASLVSGHPLAATERTMQRHFLKTTGMTLKTYSQIARAREAMSMIERGMRAADIAYSLGYADQPHLIRSLRTFMGTTPGQLARESNHQNGPAF